MGDRAERLWVFAFGRAKEERAGVVLDDGNLKIEKEKKDEPGGRVGIGVGGGVVLYKVGR